LLAVLATVAFGACTKGGPQGKRLASGLAREVIVAPGVEWPPSSKARRTPKTAACRTICCSAT